MRSIRETLFCCGRRRPSAWFSLVIAVTLFSILILPVAALGHPYTPSGSYSPFVWDPAREKWINGISKGYAESDSAAMVVEIKGAVGSEWKIDLCLQAYDGPKGDQEAFVGFSPWDVTVGMLERWPDGTAVEDGLFGNAALVQGYGLTIVKVAGPAMPQGGCRTGYLGLTVEYTKTSPGPAYITYGGVISDSAAEINGTFQSRLEGTGEKTINFKVEERGQIPS